MDHNDILSALYDCLEYFEDRQDADYEGEESGYVPNEEMVIADQVLDVIKYLELDTP